MSTQRVQLIAWQVLVDPPEQAHKRVSHDREPLQRVAITRSPDRHVQLPDHVHRGRERQRCRHRHRVLSVGRPTPGRGMRSMGCGNFCTSRMVSAGRSYDVLQLTLNVICLKLMGTPPQELTGIIDGSNASGLMVSGSRAFLYPCYSASPGREACN
jgi:hypothetical protein